MKKVNYVGCIIELEENKGNFLLQLRDNTNISNPNTLSTFGGRVEAGETEFDALKRELFEELKILIKDNELKYVGYFEKFDEFKNHFVGCTYFHYSLPKLSEIKCEEGNPVILHKKEIIFNKKIGKISREMHFRHFTCNP